MAGARLDEVTRRRVRAARLLQRGKRPAEVAESGGVACQTLYRWKAVLEEQGFEALRSLGGPGPKSRLSDSDLAVLRKIHMKSPTLHGFGTEPWTPRRVGVVIKRHFGVAYGTTQVWRTLSALGFSVQKPEKRAIERDEDAVKRWKGRTGLP